MFDPTASNKTLVDGKYTQLVPLGSSLVQQVVHQKFWINLGFWETAHLPLP